MTVRSSRPSTARSANLNRISEEEASSLHEEDSIRPPSTPSPSYPTEYHRSFRTRGGPRPRNPVNGWQARNLSNILPAGPEAPSGPLRASRRPAPESWLSRQVSSHSNIFPGAPPLRQPEPNNAAAVDVVNTAGSPDVNNNPWVPPPIVVGGRRRTGQWPWQIRAQTSSIFLSEAENTAPPPRPHRFPQNRYPWQERAQKSIIFEVLSGQDTGPKRKPRRSYQWDQRQSKLMTEAVQQMPQEEPLNSETKRHRQQQSMRNSSCPWKERAIQSVVFRSPEKPNVPRPINFAWDQRRSGFSIQLEPTAQFSKGSSYKDTFVPWQTIPNDNTVKPAGKPCYTSDENEKLKKQEMSIIGPGAGGGKRKFKLKSSSSSSSREIIALPPPPPPLHKSSSRSKLVANFKPTDQIVNTSVKGATCLDIVPVGYRFSNHKSSSGGRRT